MMSAMRTMSAGLCSTCNNGPTCGYRALRGCDALLCEMFDDFVPSPNGGNGAGEVDLRAFKTVAVEQITEPTEPKEYKGLCINCESRETCRLAKSEGGIWHCEEYK